MAQQPRLGWLVAAALSITLPEGSAAGFSA